MTQKYENVYLLETAVITGPYEKKGPLVKYFDYSYDDLYFGNNTWEQAEAFLLNKSVELLLSKLGIKKEKVDLFISGDLLNQLMASNLVASKEQIPYFGIYNACASGIEGLIIAANMIQGGLKNIICSVSSHNNAAEKQFRNPVEYGGPKPKRSTFTVTGGVSGLVSKTKSNIKIESSTIGVVSDMNQKDVYNMGAVMASAAGDTIYKHLKDMNRSIGYYDMVFTGDLGVIGKKILKDYLKEAYNIKLEHYDDTACMIYDLNSQEVNSGGSGPACVMAVTYSYIVKKMREGKWHKVLIVGTGSLHNTTLINQKLSIPSIAHAISLEVIK